MIIHHLIKVNDDNTWHHCYQTTLQTGKILVRRTGYRLIIENNNRTGIINLHENPDDILINIEGNILYIKVIYEEKESKILFIDELV